MYIYVCIDSPPSFAIPDPSIYLRLSTAERPWAECCIDYSLLSIPHVLLRLSTADSCSRSHISYSSCSSSPLLSLKSHAFSLSALRKQETVAKIRPMPKVAQRKR